MIERYVLPEMGAVWSDEARLGHWLEIEILVAEALAGLGVVPDADAREIRAKASFDAEQVAEVERVTRHDVAAFVQVVAGSVGPAGRWVHVGLTSSDVLDTGLARIGVGDHAEPSQRLRDEDLDLEPVPEPRLVGPDRAHLREEVALDHGSGWTGSRPVTAGGPPRGRP